MKTTLLTVLGAFAFAQVTQAHINLEFPPPFRGKNNPNVGPDKVDNDMTAPITAAGFPCKGYQVDLGTDAGKPTAEFAQGGQFNFTTAGSAVHGGGSCQVSLSYDKGASFKVIQSYIGDCPAIGKAFDFSVPSDAPTGEALFAWTWQNKIGNREYYMNCAAVTITGSKAKAKRASAPFSSRPDLFVVNLGNGCTTADNVDVVYPNPGPDVVGSTSATGTIVGTCAAVKGVGAGSGSGSAPAAPAPATSSAAGGSPTTLATVASSSKAAAGTLPGGVFATTAASAPTSAPAAVSSSVSEAPAPSATAAVPSSQAPAPVATPDATTASPAAPVASGSTNGVSGAQTGACTTEGMYNCIGGTSFQRCASGTWSVAMPVAAGTKCTAGQNTSLDIGFARVRRHRHIRKHLSNTV